MQSVSLMTQSKTNNTKVTILSISEEACTLNAIKKEMLKEGSFEPGKLFVNISVSLEKNIGEPVDVLSILPKVEYLYKNSDNEGDFFELVSLVARFDFRVITDDLSFENSPDGIINLSENVMESLLKMCICSIRGMLAIKTAGHVLSRYPLQIVSQERIDKILSTITYTNNEPKKSIKRKNK